MEGLTLVPIIHLHADKPPLEAIAPAIEVIEAGGVVAYPTETFYGLGVDALNGEAIKKIYTLKKRSFSQPLLMLISHREVLPTYVREVPEVARRLIHKFWLGPLTLIFFAAPHLPPLLCAHTGKVAVRISSHPIAQVLVEAVNFPITS
ncbi:MAG: L-threonylcarbamoyladenylate synthase, partial [Pseudomonadota bacterium]